MKLGIDLGTAFRRMYDRTRISTIYDIANKMALIGEQGVNVVKVFENIEKDSENIPDVWKTAIQNTKEKLDEFRKSITDEEYEEFEKREGKSLICLFFLFTIFAVLYIVYSKDFTILY